MKTMKESEKGIIASAVVAKLNDVVRAKNKELCKANLHSEQKPLHGFDMFMKLCFLSDDELGKIAASCGI